MPCYSPITAWYSLTTNPSGKRQVVFNSLNAQPGSKMLLPCSNCIGCRLANAGQWATRIMHEAREHELATFLTLTYRNLDLPKGGTLVKRDFQIFMKRLRKYHHSRNPDAPKIKYYMCGEYGGNTQRAHYHAIVFGLDFGDKRFHKKTKRGDSLYTSKILDDIWGLGHCFIGSVSHKSAGYVARYCLKKINGEMAIEHYKTVNTETGEITTRQKEYMAASQGIGLAHFEEHYQQMYLRDSCIVEGKQTPVPKYYDRKLQQINPELLEQIKQRRKEKALLRKADNTPERLAVRKEVKEAQVNLLKRDLPDD